MRKYILPLIAIILTSIIAIPATPTQAANSITLGGTACLVSANGGWNVSADLHNNGLIYAAVTVGGLNTGRMRIVVLDPNNPNSVVPGSLGLCSIVASLDDPTPNNGFLKGSALQMPSIVKADSNGNIFIGRVTTSGFRVFVISADAPATPSGALNETYMRNVLITGAPSANNSGGGMDVSDDYLVASIGQDMTGTQRNRYTIISKSTLFALPTMSASSEDIESITGTWTPILTAQMFHSYTKLSSGTDAVAALPNGRFFVAAAFEPLGSLAGFLNPANNTVTNIYSGGSGWANLCTSQNGTFASNCLMPSAYIGLDNNLYVGIRSHYGEKVMRYNTTTNRWESAIGAPAFPSSFDTFYPDNGARQLKFGTGIISDGIGQVFVSSIHWNGRTYGPLNLAYYNLTEWQDKTFSGSGNEYGKPQLLITPYTGESGRLSVFYVRDIITTPTTVWITYSGNVIASGSAPSICNVNTVVNGSLPFTNSTTVTAAIYTSLGCQTPQYYAVASASATPPASVNAANLLPFDPASGAISVSGLTPGATNYIHVAMFDADDARVGDWMTQSIYVDTAATVGATFTISSPFNKPRYTDVSSMNGSSYTDTSYTRSNIGQLSIDGVTDPSGLSSYQVNDDTAINYTEALLGQNSLIMMRENAGNMGASVSLKDGAGNIEVRASYPLTLDAQPPVPGGTESITFAATGTSPFNGEVTLVNGNTTTDNEVVWGLWLASAYCGATNAGCPANDSSSLRWGGVPMTSYKAKWNLLTGNNISMQTGVYRIYARILDGAGNPTSTVYTRDVSVTFTGNTVYAPVLFAQR